MIPYETLAILDKFPIMASSSFLLSVYFCSDRIPAGAAIFLFTTTLRPALSPSYLVGTGKFTPGV
jgi:hypothetical protein